MAGTKKRLPSPPEVDAAKQRLVGRQVRKLFPAGGLPDSKGRVWPGGHAVGTVTDVFIDEEDHKIAFDVQ